MDRVQSSSRKSRDEKERDRESHRDHKHHRSSNRSKESEERHHSDMYREEKKHHHRDGDHRHRSRDHEEPPKRERSYEPPRSQREDEERSSHKRKERADSEDDRLEKSEKKNKTDNKREKRRYEDREEKREKRRYEDIDDVVEVSRDFNGIVVKEEKVQGYEEDERKKDENGGRKRERRRFGDKVKEEDVDVKLENEDHTATSNGSSSEINGVALGSVNVTSTAVTEPSSELRPTPSIKVSLISTTNENKGVNVTRSHEVPGKSSTDGTTTSTAGKSGNLSLDALAKAKKALQMQKELSEKLKKIPQLNKISTPGSDGIPPFGPNKVGSNVLSARIGTGSTASTTAAGVATATAQASALPAVGSASASSAPALAGLTTVPNIEAIKRAQELAAKMGFHHDPEFAPLINMFPGQMPTDVTVQQKPAKAPVLRLDPLGREIDEHGNVINVAKPANLSTLKVNINKQKKEAFQILKPELDVDPESNPHFDPEMGINKNKLLRPKRMSIVFVEEGKWSKDAETIRFKSQFGEAQAKELKTKQAQLAKAKAEPDINPNLIEVSERVITKEKPKDPIPDVEWWDVSLLRSGTYGEITEESVIEDKLKMDKITVYVEHPLPVEPPAEPAPPPPQPLKLTKKEQKKLRTQRRLAKEKDKQEMIRQGVIEPPKPKVKMSNLMKVLGAEATQDPTKLEMEIRSAALEREQAHVDRNIARKLTPAERREKKERKLFEDPNTLETFVSIYRINDLSDKKTRFKVDMNAQQNRLSGCAVMGESMCVVVVEGGSKAIKRYGKLMLRRIDWATAVPDENEEDDEIDDKPVNKCVLVWQGSVAKPNFNRFIVHQCRTEAAARKVFSDAGVAHYWDLAANFKDDEI